MAAAAQTSAYVKRRIANGDLVINDLVPFDPVRQQNAELRS